MTHQETDHRLRDLKEEALSARVFGPFGSDLGYFGSVTADLNSLRQKYAAVLGRELTQPSNSRLHISMMERLSEAICASLMFRAGARIVSLRKSSAFVSSGEVGIFRG